MGTVSASAGPFQHYFSQLSLEPGARVTIGWSDGSAGKVVSSSGFPVLLVVCLLVHRLRSLGTVRQGARFQAKGLILAQNERWRRGLGMQVERERFLRGPSKVADG